MTPRSPDRPTLGPRLAVIAESLGRPLLPHQRALADVALELDVEHGRMAYDQVVLVGPRQVTGKSEFLFDVMTHRCLGFDRALTDWIAAEFGVRHRPPGPQKVVYTAQTADDAREKWRDVHLKRLQASPFGSLFEPRLRLNAEAMVWRNGSMWSPSSATAKTSGTGDTLDLPVIDEAWSRRDSRTELGLRPATMTRPWRQLWVASMVPGPSRVGPHEWPYLRQKMAAGRARVEAGVRERVCYCEFSAEPGLDPGDPATWWTCMPALGYTTQEQAVASDFEDLPLADFEAEYLGWPPAGGAVRWAVVAEDVWDGLYDANSQAADPVALGLAVTPEGTAGSIGVVGLRQDADLHLELVDRRPGSEWMVERVVDLVGTWAVCAVGVDPASPAGALILPLEQALASAGLDVPVVKPTVREYAGACARLLAATGQLDETELAEVADEEDVEDVVRLRVHHIAQPELTRAVAGAIRKYTGRLWRWERAAGAIDICPLESVTLGMHAGTSVGWEGVATYDIASSLG